MAIGGRSVNAGRRPRPPSFPPCRKYHTHSLAAWVLHTCIRPNPQENATDPLRRLLLPFRVRCPRCGQTAEIAEEHLGRQGQCNNCGALVAIPARLSKVCSICGVDLANTAHTKDQSGNYICTSCHETRQVAASSASGRIECSLCHVHFPREQSTGPADEPICPDCETILQAQRLPVAIPITENVQPRRPLPRPPMPQAPSTPAAAGSSTRLPLILSSIALIGVCILAVLHFANRKEAPLTNSQAAQPDNSDQQILTRVLILKSQAEVLIEVGKLREGIAKYDELLRLPSTPAIAAELESARSAREKALKALAAATPQPSDEKHVIAPEPPKKSGTILNE